VLFHSGEHGLDPTYSNHRSLADVPWPTPRGSSGFYPPQQFAERTGDTRAARQPWETCMAARGCRQGRAGTGARLSWCLHCGTTPSVKQLSGWGWELLISLQDNLPRDACHDIIKLEE